MPAGQSPALRDRATPSKHRGERRQNVRFPISLPVRYRLSKSHGWGRTVNIGSGGALFTVDQPVRPGQQVELCIGWPVLLHEKVHLNLIAYGMIERVDEGRAAVSFERYAFRTANSAFRRQALRPELRDATPAHG
jgi:hypothetical protein